MYHGIIIDQSFKDPSFVNVFKSFNKKQDGNWGIYGIEVEDNELNKAISDIQENLKDDQPWYVHFYNDTDLIVLFKKMVFKVTPDISTWKPFLDYGKELNIPEDQLQVQPIKFQDETHYFQ